MSEHRQDVEIIVVVSGLPERIRIKVHKTLEQLVDEALRKSGNEGQPPADWDLRTDDGQLLNQSLTIAAAGIHDGTTLFLSPKAGAGG